MLNSGVKYFTWDNAKNEKLKAERGVSFEEIVFHLERGDLLDLLDHPNQQKYEQQKIMVVEIDGYAWLVPCLFDHDKIVLKTIIPSRKATRKYIERRTM